MARLHELPHSTTLSVVFQHRDIGLQAATRTSCLSRVQHARELFQVVHHEVDLSALCLGPDPVPLRNVFRRAADEDRTQAARCRSLEVVAVSSDEGDLGRLEPEQAHSAVVHRGVPDMPCEL
jgi:hypothetical protein